MLRPHTLTASFIPVFVGTMLALVDGVFDSLLFAAMLLASMLIQSATNMFNEYFDYKRGLDNEDSVGIGGTIVRDGIAPKVVLKLGYIFFGLAVLLGVFICMFSSWWIAVVGTVCMIVGYLYTGGSHPIAYTPFGEVSAGFMMGTVIIGISYFIQTGRITSDVLLISIPTALFISCLLLANNIRDLKGDKENGRRTIAILLGRRNAIVLEAGAFVFIYLITIYFIVSGMLPWWSFLTFLSMIKALSAIKKFKGKNTPAEMLPAMVDTGKANTIYGIMLGISLLLSYFV